MLREGVSAVDKVGKPINFPQSKTCMLDNSVALVIFVLPYFLNVTNVNHSPVWIQKHQRLLSLFFRKLIPIPFSASVFVYECASYCIRCKGPPSSPPSNRTRPSSPAALLSDLPRIASLGSVGRNEDSNGLP